MSHLINGRRRVQIKHNGQYIADKLFPKGTPKEDVDAWTMRVKLGLIDPLREDASPTFNEFVSTFIHEHAEVHTLPATVIKKKSDIENHLAPIFGKMILSEIRPKHVIKLQADLWNNGNGKSPQTIANILSAASLIFKFAVTKEFMEYNPCTSVTRIRRKVKKSPTYWSFAERNRFLAFCQNENWELYQLVAFAVTTGLRPGELQGLQRSRLDFGNCFITVDQNWCTKTNKLNPWTKGKIDRRVTVPQPIMEILSNKRGLPPDAYVFSQSIPFNTLGHNLLKPMAIRADVTPIRFHDLRHTFASHCVLKGKHQVEIRDLLGHAKLSSTDVYMHLSKDDLKGATDCLVDGMPWLVDHDPKVVSIHTRK